MTRAIVFCALLGLTGCGGVVAMPIALQVLSGLASVATVADRVLDIDISLAQARRDKIPLLPVLGLHQGETQWQQ